ncbi:MAG: protocatechuate 3,4-dioxygenase subunit alpha [Pseudomonadota bacterium]
MRRPTRSALPESASQTAGPYVHIGCVPNHAGITGVYPQDLGAQMLDNTTPGPRITVEGVIYDGTGTPLRDGLVEVWQADALGTYDGSTPGFTGWARRACDGVTGLWQIETIKPGQVPFVDGRPMAPHLSLWIVARGVNVGLNTRMYFPDEPEANKVDPVLSRIEHQNRVPTLLAVQTGPGAYRFDIHLQGPNETVFFDV